jgi:hypothetical protein
LEPNSHISYSNGLSSSFEPNARRESLQELKQGRKLVELNVSGLVETTNAGLVSTGLADHVAVITYGACGNLHFISRSDTDYTFLHDGTPKPDQLIKLQEAIHRCMSALPHTVSFKAWDRIQPNLLELMCLDFICGNPTLFEKQVVNNQKLWSFDQESFLISHFACLDRIRHFRSSLTFGKQLRTWKDSKEIPEGLGYGELKYFNSGLRGLNSIPRAATLYSDTKLFKLADENILVKKGILTTEQLADFHNALDYFLAARDICVLGSNIFNPRNLRMLQATWGQSREEITADYDRHSQKALEIMLLLQETVIHDFPDHPGVRSAISTDSSELLGLLNSGDLNVWGTLALRNDISERVRGKLEQMIQERKKVSPHTMLSDLEYSIKFAREEGPLDPKRPPAEPTGEQAAGCWLTDQIFDAFNVSIGEKIHYPAVVRQAIEQSYLRLYEAGKFPTPKEFHEAYALRARNYLYTRTIFPDQPMAQVTEVCNKILDSTFSN